MWYDNRVKTKKLIELLQKVDPTGETEVCVGNYDILQIFPSPAWYDGSLQVLIRDERLLPLYDVIGGKFVRNGDKIVIETLSIQDVLLDDPGSVIKYDEWKDDSDESRVKKWREDGFELEKEIEKIKTKLMFNDENT